MVESREYPAIKPDALKDAEARGRALTREVGSLREDLKRETRRRERAVARAKECEQLQQQADEKVKELSYANRKLTQELESTQTAARTATEKNRKALQALREGLAAVEAAVIDRAKHTQQLVEVSFPMLLRLQRLLFHPHVALKGLPPLSAVAAPEVQQLMEGLTRQLSAVATLASGSAGPEQAGNGGQVGREALFMPPMPAAGENLLAKAQEAEEVQQLATRLQLAKTEATSAQQEASQLAQLLQHYQVELEELRGQLSSSMASMADAAREKDGLAQQDELLRHELQELERRYEEAASRSHSQMASAMSELAQANSERANLVDQVRMLQQRCMSAEETLVQLQADHAAIQGRLAEREERMAQQSATISELQAAISEQRADIRSALQLVSKREAGGTTRPGSTEPLWQPPAQPPAQTIRSHTLAPHDDSRSGHGPVQQHTEALRPGPSGARPQDPPWLPGQGTRHAPHHQPASSSARIQIKPSTQSSVELLHGTLWGQGQYSREGSPSGTAEPSQHSTLTFAPRTTPEFQQPEPTSTSSQRPRLTAGAPPPPAPVHGWGLSSAYGPSSSTGPAANSHTPHFLQPAIPQHSVPQHSSHWPSSRHPAPPPPHPMAPAYQPSTQQAWQPAQQPQHSMHQAMTRAGGSSAAMMCPADLVRHADVLLADMQAGGGGNVAGKPAVVQLRQDMRVLDDEIAELEATLKAAALRLT